MESIKFPYYSGNIYKTNVLGHVTLDYFCKAHKNPTKETIEIINKVKKASENNDNILKRKLKHRLYSFTPSVYIPVNQSRKYDNVIEYTGLMQLDFDKIEDVDTAIDLKKWLFEQPEVIVSYISPSGKGVKGLISIKKPEDKEHYKAIFKSIASKYEVISYFDKATKNAMLPLFLSIDEDLLSKEYKNVNTWMKEDWSVVKHVRLNDSQPPNFNPNEDDFNKTIRILKNKINNITNDGHTQVRSAALILGSRVSAGYISINEAQNEIEILIRSNSYLKKGTSGYISTALWGISEGYKTPKYYD